jgi:hypothetical protein
MAKQFTVILPNGTVSEFTARQYMDAMYTVNAYVGAYGYDGTEEAGLECYIKGDMVSSKDFIDACEGNFDMWLAAKKLTHKRIKVLHGSSVACYVYKWIKK